MAEKLSSGIDGLDSILYGGYLKGLPTIIKGSPGTGKTIATLFFAHAQYVKGNKVLYLSCDESPQAIINNMNNFGLEATRAEKEGKLQFMDVRPNFEEEIVGEFTGEYELGTVLLRIQENLDTENPIVIIDSLQNLLMPGKSRIAEKDIYKLFEWSRQNNITLLVTDVLDSALTKVGVLEEYATDCVIKLEQKHDLRLMTRYLTVTKMRGSGHGTNKYPFCLTEKGILIFPVASFDNERDYEIERLKMGVKTLDEMLGGGLIKSSFALMTGRTGTAKTLLAATFAHTSAAAGKKVVFVSFEESRHDLINNVRSIGIDLEPLISQGKLNIVSTRPTEYGVEYHLLRMLDMLKEEKPQLFIMDPLSALLNVADNDDVKDLLVHFTTLVRKMGITVFANELLHECTDGKSEIALSSIVDTLIEVQQAECDGEYYRLINVRKSRGSNTSSQQMEYIITDNGIVVDEPYIGTGGMVFGSAKHEKMMRDKHYKVALLAELEAIKKGLEIFAEYKNGDVDINDAKMALLHQELLEKQNILEHKLDDIEKLKALNRKSRE